MISSEILMQARLFVARELGSDTTGHDWWHAKRVSEAARKIAQAESADPDICELAALLHDLPDDKRGIKEEDGLRLVQSWLEQAGLDGKTSEHILNIISTMSFRGGNNPPMETNEGKVVQDADRLDAIGAVGIARAFAYSGHAGQKIYDPEIKVRNSMSRNEYRNGISTAINHFSEKLLKVEALLNTASARKLAMKRQKFMEDFMQQFMKEWNSEE